MYRIAAIIGIGGVLAAAAVRYFVRKKSRTENPVKVFVFDRTQPVKMLIYAVTGLSILGLALTGFWAALLRNRPLSDFLLILHCTAAAFFCLSLPATLILGAQKYRFLDADWSRGLCFSGLRKVCFWVLMAAAIPVILSIMLSMLPIFGTVGQEFLYQLHRSSTLILTMAALGFIGLSR